MATNLSEKKTTTDKQADDQCVEEQNIKLVQVNNSTNPC